MREFFSMDGAFNKYGGMLADMVLLSLMWILFCIPVITAGASTTALFYVTTRRISNREGYITSDFWSAFKSNFKKATILWLIILAITLMLLVNFITLGSLEEMPPGIFSFMLPAQLVFAFLLSIINVYVYPLMARFDMGLIQVVKSAFFMSVRHFLTSVTCVGMVILIVFMFLSFPQIAPVILVAPGAYAWLASMMIMKVFKRYRPEMDKDPAQEIAEIEAKKAEERWKQRDEASDEASDEAENDD